MFVAVAAHWPTETFRRKGRAFTKSTPVDLDAKEMADIADDLGHALFLINPDNHKADPSLTAEAAADLPLFLKRRCPVPMQIDALTQTAKCDRPAAEPSNDATGSDHKPDKTEPPKKPKK